VALRYVHRTGEYGIAINHRAEALAHASVGKKDNSVVDTALAWPIGFLVRHVLESVSPAAASTTATSTVRAVHDVQPMDLDSESKMSPPSIATGSASVSLNSYTNCVRTMSQTPLMSPCYVIIAGVGKHGMVYHNLAIPDLQTGSL